MFHLQFPAWLTLWILAPLLGELFSGSSPPRQFFHPGMFLMLAVLYGGGALLAREYTLLWQKDWRSLLLLGVAYGIAEEGLMCKSFFNPQWPDVGKLGEYGRWIGVNWVWAYFLTLYHTFYSVATSVMLAEILHYRQRADLWLKPWSRRLLLGLLLLDIGVGYRFFPYQPPPLLIAVAGGVIALLIWAAKHLPERGEPNWDSQNVSAPWKFTAWGFGASLLFFVAMFIGPSTDIPASIYLILSAVATIACGKLLWRMSGGGQAWTPVHRASLILGVFFTFALLGILLEANPKASPEDTRGMGVVAVGAVALGALAVSVSRHHLHPAREIEP